MVLESHWMNIFPRSAYQNGLSIEGRHCSLLFNAGTVFKLLCFSMILPLHHRVWTVTWCLIKYKEYLSQAIAKTQWIFYELDAFKSQFIIWTLLSYSQKQVHVTFQHFYSKAIAFTPHICINLHLRYFICTF